MERISNIRLRLLGLGIGLVAVVIGVNGCFDPNVGPAPTIKVAMTSEAIARGYYLTNHVVACIYCHSKQEDTKMWYPVIPGTEGAGGRIFPGPGVYYAANLTPYHLGTWTDVEILRAFTTGVNKDGKALFPIMPYLSFGKMDENDAMAIVAYLRTLKPIENDVPASHSKFPMNLIEGTIPTKAQFEQRPDKADVVRYGAYLANLANCIECHTVRGSFGSRKKGSEFSGGQEFPLPTGGTIRSANLTPDIKTGIGAWTKETFVARFKAFDNQAAANSKAARNSYNSIMPWLSFAGMTDEDLGAIYAYLRSVKPIEHEFQQFTPGE